MQQTEQKNISSTCQKCGGYVDHYSLTCIDCWTIYDPNHPQNTSKKDVLEKIESNPTHMSKN